MQKAGLLCSSVFFFAFPLNKNLSTLVPQYLSNFLKDNTTRYLHEVRLIIFFLKTQNIKTLAP